MAGDLIRLNVGSGGDFLATDELTTGTASGGHAQRVKVGYGEEGVFQDVASGTGLPVNLVGAITSLTVAGSISIAAMPVSSVWASQVTSPWVTLPGSTGAIFSAVGSVLATQGGAPWSTVGSVNVYQAAAASLQATVIGSVQASQAGAPWTITGSVGATQLGAPWSATGSVNVFQAAAASLNATIVGSVLATQGGAPWSTTGSVGATQLGAPWTVTGSVQATQATSPWVTLAGSSGAIGLVSGSVQATQAGAPWTVTGSVQATQATSPWVVLPGSSGAIGLVSGSVQATQAGAPWSITGSVQATQATSPWVTLVGSTGAILSVVGSQNVQGTVAHGDADAGNPVKVGGFASVGGQVAVASGDRVNAIYDDLGRTIVILGNVRDLAGAQRTVITSATEVVCVNTPAAGLFRDLTFLAVHNGSPSSIWVDIRTDSGGTPLVSVHAAGVGGGAVYPMAGDPLKHTTVQRAWTAQIPTAVQTIVVFAKYIDHP